MDMERLMYAALDEAYKSLREGNSGFGAVIAKDGEIVAAEHDRAHADGDATSHAELNAIRAASGRLGRDLAGCALVSTHEPCPMCATAMIWSGVSELAYGYSIADAIRQGRKRIDLRCAELIERAGAAIVVREGVLHDQCAVLYRSDVRKEIERLRCADEAALRALNEDSAKRRTAWFEKHKDEFSFLSDDLLDSAYRLLLKRFGATPEELPVVWKDETKLIFHSGNFCPRWRPAISSDWIRAMSAGG